MSLSALSIPRIGQPWPEQGGIYIGEMLGENGQPNHHLILPLDPRANFGNWEWGKCNQNIDGCSHVRDGLANTRAMAEADNELAKQILSLEINGFNDFYLPSLAESFYCFAVAREHFDKDWHWTSTQCSAATRTCRSLAVAARTTTTRPADTVPASSADSLSIHPFNYS